MNLNSNFIQSKINFRLLLFVLVFFSYFSYQMTLFDDLKFFKIFISCCFSNLQKNIGNVILRPGASELFESRAVSAHQKYLLTKQIKHFVQTSVVTSLYDFPISEFLKLFCSRVLSFQLMKQLVLVFPNPRFSSQKRRDLLKKVFFTSGRMVSLCKTLCSWLNGTNLKNVAIFSLCHSQYIQRVTQSQAKCCSRATGKTP